MKISNQFKFENQLLVSARNRRILAIAFLLAVSCAVMPSLALADGQTAGQPIATPAENRYGLFGLMDHRSSYGQGPYPEPFIVDDTNLERNEARLDWQHTQVYQGRTDSVKAEIEKGFGLVTFELEVPYEVDTNLKPKSTTDGFDAIDLGVRCPVYQFVPDNNFFDTTFGVAFEVGIPTYSSISKDTELVPKIFNDLRVGDHFTLQSIAGYSKLSGVGDDGGAENFEYGLVLGYAIPHQELPIPGVLELIPVFELSGETALNHGAGHNILTGNAAVRFNLKPIGSVQPRLGVGYVFPVDSGARDEMQWGVMTSLVFEY